MKTIHIKDNDHELITDPLCAAIGNFDGVHLGHQKLIEECKRHGYKSAVLTFYPHPSVFLKKIPDYKLITPIAHKADIFSRMGIDYLIIIEFNDDIAKLSKETFISWMKRLNIKSCVCGYDFTFGRKAEGTILDLAKEFEFYEVKKFIFDDVRVSSTYIRELLSLGEVSKVNRMLGRTFSIRGKVNYGTQNGRLIGFPTANVDYKNYFLPANGVYFVTVQIDHVLYFGMCNIGNNPTFNYSFIRKLEVNVFGLDADIYDAQIEVFFHEKIRDEAAFPSKEALISQLEADRKKCYLLSADMNFTK
ncbi:MAG: bifunctional riboflavin kinase/FAD synthetase [Anaeroplasmataceae bacterium]|nr:bifunctional riboflavin kinase/FAD synthetase [Anaeroplasmataceae bacterium]